MRPAVRALFALLLFAVPVLAQRQMPAPRPPDKPATKAAAEAEAAPDLSAEPFVMEQAANRYRFENDGSMTRRLSARVRIQSEAGVQAWGLLRMGYNSANEEVDVSNVRVRKPDGTVVTTTAANVQDVTSQIAREAPMYSDYREKHVTVPNLRPGDVLEYDFVTRTTSPLIPGQFWLEHEFDEDTIVLEELLEADVPAGRALKLKTSKQAQAETSEKDGRKLYRWRHKNLKRPTEEEQQKRAQRTAPRTPDVQLSTFQAWDEVAGWYDGLQKDRLTVTPELKAKADELTKGLTTVEDKVRALYYFVARDFRYISVSFGVGRFQPHAPAEVFHNRYGDCKDKHTLLATLLKAAGIEAYPVLIHSRRKLDPELPSPAQFDHVITYVPTEKGGVWLDTTTELAPYGLILAGLRGKKALAVMGGKPGQLIETPEAPPYPMYQRVHAAAKLNELGRLESNYTLETRGDPEVLIRLTLRNLPKERWKQLAEIFARMNMMFGSVEDVSSSEPSATVDPLRFEFKLAQPNYVSWSGGKKGSAGVPTMRMNLPGFGGDDDDEDKEDRQDEPEPLLLGGPMELTNTLALELPPGFTIKTPVPVTVKRDYGEYRSTYKLEGQKLLVERKLVITPRELPRERMQDYNAFRRTILADEGQTLAVESATSPHETAMSSTKADDLWEAANGAIAARDFARAAQYASRATELDPKHKRAWNSLGYAYQMLGKYDDAAAAFTKQVEVSPYDIYAYKSLARIRSAQGKHDPAVEMYKKTLEVAPLDEEALAELGWLYTEMDRNADAVPVLEQAASLDRRNTIVQTSLGRAYLRTGDKQKAIAAFDQAIEIDASPLTWNNVAYELSPYPEHHERALQYAESAISSVALASNNIALERLTLRDVGLAYSLGAYWDTLGWIHYHAGRLDDAERYIRAAWVLYPHGEVGEHLGQIYERKEMKEKAIETYAISLNASRPRPQTRALLAKLVPEKQLDKVLEKHRLGPQELRTVKLPRKLKASHSAEFWVLVSSSGPSEVRFIKGDEQLKDFARDLAAAKLPVEFPDKNPARIARRGILSCTAATGECTFVVLTPEAVNSID